MHYEILEGAASIFKAEDIDVLELKKKITSFKLKYILALMELHHFWMKSCLHFHVRFRQPAWSSSNKDVCVCTFTDLSRILTYDRTAANPCWRLWQNWKMVKRIVSYQCWNVGSVFTSPCRGLCQQFWYQSASMEGRKKGLKQNPQKHTLGNYDNWYHRV